MEKKDELPNSFNPNQVTNKLDKDKRETIDKVLSKPFAIIDIGEGSTKLKNGKATEIDKLRNEIIKYCIKDNLFWKSRKLCLVTSLMTELIPSSGKLTL